MKSALADAKVITPDQVQYINAHGTSTPLGDKAETQAVKNVYGSITQISSVFRARKSQLGHSLGASGGIEAVVCVKTLLHQT